MTETKKTTHELITAVVVAAARPLLADAVEEVDHVNGVFVHEGYSALDFRSLICVLRSLGAEATHLQTSSVLFRLSVSLPCISVVRLILLLSRESLKLNQRGGAFVLHSFILKNALCCFESISSLLLLRSSETFCYLDDILHGVASDRDAAKNHDVRSFGLSKGVLPG